MARPRKPGGGGDASDGYWPEFGGNDVSGDVRSNPLAKARRKPEHDDFDFPFGSGASERLGLSGSNPMARPRPAGNVQSSSSSSSWWPSTDGAASRLGEVLAGINPLARPQPSADVDPDYWPGMEDAAGRLSQGLPPPVGGGRVGGSNPLARSRELRGGPSHDAFWDEADVDAAARRLETAGAGFHDNPLAAKRAPGPRGRAAFEPEAAASGLPEADAGPAKKTLTRAWQSRRSRLAGMGPGGDGTVEAEFGAAEASSSGWGNYLLYGGIGLGALALGAYALSRARR
jgi:hypothetical protein